MAAQDKSVTYLGSATKVAGVRLQPMLDGTCVIEVHGVTLTADGQGIGLKPAEGRIPMDGEHAAPLLALALRALRAANGLEAGPDPLKPEPVLIDSSTLPTPPETPAAKAEAH